MNYKIIADSCCDLTTELEKRCCAFVVPLNVNLGDKSFVDDEKLDVPLFVTEMEKCKEKIGTSAPSPIAYKEAFEGSDHSFAVTLSKHLSSSNNSAHIGKDMLKPDEKEKIHIFDSKSASAGEVLVVLKIKELIDEGLQKLNIIENMEKFIKNMKTFFVLDNINNLVKSGRLNKIVGKLVSVLGIKPLMGSDGDGNIAFFSYARGEKQIIQKLSETIMKSGKNTDGEKIVISHCENLPLAQKLKEAIEKTYRFGEILVVPMRAVSSMYASRKGIVLAF